MDYVGFSSKVVFASIVQKSLVFMEVIFHEVNGVVALVSVVSVLWSRIYRRRRISWASSILLIATAAISMIRKES